MNDLSPEEIQEVLQLAEDLKAKKFTPQRKALLGLLFYKPSTRTRVSFSAAIHQLGGQFLELNPNSSQISRGETIADTARILSGYIDVLAIRTFAQQDLELFAHYADIPIINALSDHEHPCQVLADLLTIQECLGYLPGITLAYVGDGNNVAHSLLLGCAMMGINIRVATPPEYQPAITIVEKAKAIAANRTEVAITNDPILAVKTAQIVYTDMWASMGQDDSASARISIFQPYQVNEELLSHAEEDAIFMHCLPAQRGLETTDEVIDGKRSLVWQQAQNRMHVQKAILLSLLGVD